MTTRLMSYHEAKIHEYIMSRYSSSDLTVGAISRYMNVSFGLTPLEAAIMIAHMMSSGWCEFKHEVPHLIVEVTVTGMDAYKHWSDIPF